MIGRDQLVGLTRQLVDVPSVTGEEKAVAILVGPDSVFDAHTPGEEVSKMELSRAVDLYVELVKELDNWRD